MSSEMIEEITPEQKAAAVVVSLGADKASKIYKHLSESDIEKLTIEVAKLGHVTPEQISPHSVPRTPECSSSVPYLCHSESAEALD